MGVSSRGSVTNKTNGRLFSKNSKLFENAIKNCIKDKFKSKIEIAKELDISYACVRRYINKMDDLEMLDVEEHQVIERNEKLYWDYKGWKYKLKTL